MTVCYPRTRISRLRVNSMPIGCPARLHSVPAHTARARVRSLFWEFYLWHARSRRALWLYHAVIDYNVNPFRSIASFRFHTKGRRSVVIHLFVYFFLFIPELTPLYFAPK